MWRVFRYFTSNIGSELPCTHSRAVTITAQQCNSKDDFEQELRNNPDSFTNIFEEGENIYQAINQTSKFDDPILKKQLDDLRNNKLLSIGKSNKHSEKVLKTEEIDSEILRLLKKKKPKKNETKRASISKEDSKSEGASEYDASSLGSADKFGTLAGDPLPSYDYVGDEGEKKMEEHERRLGAPKDDTIEYANRMKKLVHEGNLQEALAILEVEMPSVMAKPDVYCYRQILKGCAKVGNTWKAFKIYNKMKKDGLQPKPVVYTLLFTACGNSPDPQDGLARATKLRNQLFEKHVVLNEVNYNSMIRAFGRCGDLRTAVELVDEMVEKKIWVTQNTISFVLQACISDKETGFRHALMVWKKMRTMSINPTIYHFNLLLRCTRECGAGQQDLLMDMLKQASTLPLKTKEKILLRKAALLQDFVDIKPSNNDEMLSLHAGETPSNESTALTPPSHQGVTPPTILVDKPSLGSIEGITSLDTPIDRLAVLGGSAGFIAQMKMQGVDRNIKTYTQLLQITKPTQEEEENLLNAMIQDKIPPDVAFCNLLIKRRNCRRDYSGAKAVLDIMREHRLVPDAITFGCLAVACPSLEDAEQLLGDMDRISCRPNVIIMSSLISEALLRKKFFYALEILRKMKKYGLEPDEKMVEMLEAGRLAARKYMLEMDREPGSRPAYVYDSCRVFILEYKKWLKNSKMEVKDHPWAVDKRNNSPDDDDKVAVKS